MNWKLSATSASTLLFAILASSAQSADLTTDPRAPAAIETSEVPAVPDEVWDRLRQYQNIRSASFHGWAPAGEGMLISTRFGNSTQLHRVESAGGRREQITFQEEPVSGRFLVKSTRDEILMWISRGGDENTQLYWFDPHQHRSILLTDGKSRNTFQTMKRDGSKIIFGSNRRNGRDTDLYIADPRDPGSVELLLQVDREFWSAEDWSPDGTSVLLRRYVSINESYFATLDVVSRQRTDGALPGDGPAAIGNMAFAPDGRRILLSTDADSEFLRLARFDPASKSYTWLTAGIPWDVSDLAVDAETGKVVFAVNEDGASRLYLLEGDEPRELPLPLGIVGGLEFSPDGRQLGFSLARPDAPTDAWSIDLVSKERTRWTFSEVGGLDPGVFVPPQRIQFPSFDGRQIPAYYFRPRVATADKPVPVLINIHGGPESQYRPSFTASTQYYVNELGIAVIHPNVRGSSGYGKTYLKLDNADKREDSVRDIGALLDWIETQPELDAKRVAVMGGSYGGYMVLASLVHHGQRIRAGIDIVGIANFLTFLDKTSAYRQDLRRAEYGDERDDRMREVLARISPANHVARIRSALLVVHGKNDPRVPFSEAVQIADRVRSSGRPVWTVYADNEGHGFAKKDNDDYLRAVIALFLKANL